MVLASEAPEYEWILCESPSLNAPFAPLKKLGVLSNAENRGFTIVRNRAGSCSFVIKTTDPMAYKILDQVDLNDVRGTVRKCVRIRRNKVDLWSGPIWGIQGQLPEGNITVNCVGWLETLQKRILWSTLDYSNSGLGQPADQIAFGLIAGVNAQDLAHPLWVKPGAVTGTMPTLNRYYVLGQQLGPALQEMSDIESGYDYVVDPVTRALNLYSWDSFTTRNNIVLGFNWGPNNLKALGWAEDASKTCNAMAVISLGAPVGPIVDLASQDEYGLFEEYNTLTSANQGILAPYAEAELAIRSRPLVTYNVVPTFKNAPALFDEYQIGDEIFFSAKQGAFKIKKQGIRIFGATVNLDAVGNETISNLMLSPS